MEKELGKVCAEGLSFFGKTSRLISHELKNVLAIISETTGLLDELVELSEEGMALEPGKLRSLSVSVLEEIERANDIVRSMNAFAHGADEFIREIDIGQSLALMIKLARMDTAAKNTELNLSETVRQTVRTSPFFLENLLYHAISYALKCAGTGKKVHVSVESESDGACIRFSGLSIDTVEQFPTKKAASLSNALCAKISSVVSTGELNISLPQNIGNSSIRNLSAAD